MSQGRTVVVPLGHARTVTISVHGPVKIILGSEQQVRADSDNPIAIDRKLLGTNLLVTSVTPCGGDYTAVATGDRAVAASGDVTGIISTGDGSVIIQNTGSRSVIDTSVPIQGTVVTVPSQVRSIVIERAESYALDDDAAVYFFVQDNRR